MQAVLVAGGAGFIGSNLCKKLLDSGYSVICVDNLITGDKRNIEDLISNSRFTFIEEDITGSKFKVHPDKGGTKFKVDYVFHLASPASPNAKSPKSYINHPIETLLVNSLGTYNLLELALENKAVFLFASSSEIYGDPEVSPQNENYFGNVNPNGARSVYDEAKRFGESIVMAYVRENNVNARIVRIFNTYGSRMQPDDGRVVSNFINQAIANKPITVYGKGTQTRSFCYVDDMVDGLCRAMFTQGTKGEVINIGNPEEKTIIDLANIIKQMTNSRSTIVFEQLPEDDPKVRKPDIQKAQRLLSWQPKIELNEGLVKTIEYFKNL